MRENKGEIMANHQADFKTRYSNPIAEPKSEEFYRGRGYTYFRYGVDSNDIIPKKDFVLLPETVQKTPDYVLITSKPYFVEVKVCSDFLRLKLRDLVSYQFWNGIPGMKLLFFVYSTKYNDFKQILFHNMMALIDSGNYEIEKYHDNNKEYYKIPVGDLWKI